MKIQFPSPLFILEDSQLRVGARIGACSGSLILQNPPTKERKDEVVALPRLKSGKEAAAFLGRVISLYVCYLSNRGARPVVLFGVFFPPDIRY